DGHYDLWGTVHRVLRDLLCDCLYPCLPVRAENIPAAAIRDTKERIMKESAGTAADAASRRFDSAPGGARFLRVQVPNPPGSGKDIAEGKGVHREVESEGSRMWGTY